MKVFQKIQSQLAVLGISSISNQSTQVYSFNERIICGYLLFGCTTISQFLYIFRAADGFIDYMECICTTSANLIIAVCFVAIVYRKTTIFECIDRTESLVDASTNLFSYFY